MLAFKQHEHRHITPLVVHQRHAHSAHGDIASAQPNLNLLRNNTDGRHQAGSFLRHRAVSSPTQRSQYLVQGYDEKMMR